MREALDAPRARRKDARPAELLEAALALFVEKGFAAARAEDIAARAGVSKATLYAYFRSKEELLQVLLAQRLAACLASDGRQPAGDRSSRELLREALDTWRCALVGGDAGGIFKLVLTEARNFPGLAAFWSREVIEPTRRLVSDIVRRGIARGEFRPVDPDLVLVALVLPVIANCLHRHATGPAMPEGSVMNAPDLFSRHFELVLEGLVQSPSPGG
jgi:AcrR family transcriptional regulator